MRRRTRDNSIPKLLKRMTRNQAQTKANKRWMDAERRLSRAQKKPVLLAAEKEKAEKWSAAWRAVYHIYEIIPCPNYWGEALEIV